MTLGLLFWILWIVALVFGVWSGYPLQPVPIRNWGGGLLVFILIGILGWAQFGAPIK